MILTDKLRKGLWCYEKHEGLPAFMRQFFAENVLDDFD